MINTEISITVNRKSDLESVKKTIIEKKLRLPVYILEYDSCYEINFISDHEEWELDAAILDCFPGYEYTKELGSGRREIRIQVSRHQSEFSTDGWGRPIEDPLDETKYLVKKTVNTPKKFNPIVKVLFDDNEQLYFVNIVHGVNKVNDERGFLLLDNFRNNNEDNSAGIIKDKLYKSTLEAFHSGYRKLNEVVDLDFSAYLDKEKRKTRDMHKLPRKIIRGFITGCNASSNPEVLRNIADNLIYERRENRESILKTEGLEEFKAYLNSSVQQLYDKNFTIRSSWDIRLPAVTIGIKYFPASTESQVRQLQKYGYLKFTFQDNKIVHILDET